MKTSVITAVMNTILRWLTLYKITANRPAQCLQNTRRQQRKWLPNLWKKQGHNLHVRTCLKISVLEHGTPPSGLGQPLLNIRVRSSPHFDAWGDSSPCSERFLNTSSPSLPRWKWKQIVCWCFNWNHEVQGWVGVFVFFSDWKHLFVETLVNCEFF